MSKSVLDASALLAFLNQERGSEQVIEAIVNGGAICAINFSEVVSKISESRMPEAEIHEALDSMSLMIIDFDVQLAYKAGLLRPLTKSAGLSLGDRACLALAQHLGLPALTTDRVWKELSLDIKIQVIR
jgi:PIN domain nuclease of toxin-antitoxin system